MDIKKGQRLKPTDPTQRTRPRECAHARFDSYTGARREVKRGGEPIRIGEILPAMMAEMRARQRRQRLHVVTLRRSSGARG